MLRRRDVLKTMGGMAGTAALARFLPGCGGGGDGPPPTYVMVLMENRSYDHMLGGRTLEGLGGDGLTTSMSNPDSDGALVAPWPATVDTLCVPNPPHSWPAAHAQWNHGANDGFV